MNVAQVLIFLSNPDRMQEFLDSLDYGMWNEWDTDLVGGFNSGFGARELAAAAQEAGLLHLKLDEAEQYDT
jgi:hypothetical protein